MEIKEASYFSRRIAELRAIQHTMCPIENRLMERILPYDVGMRILFRIIVVLGNQPCSQQYMREAFSLAYILDNSINDEISYYQICKIADEICTHKDIAFHEGLIEILKSGYNLDQYLKNERYYNLDDYEKNDRFVACGYGIFIRAIYALNLFYEKYGTLAPVNEAIKILEQTGVTLCGETILALHRSGDAILNAIDFLQEPLTEDQYEL